MENTIKVLTGVVGATFSYLYGGWTVLLQTLLVFMLIDYFTALMAAGYSGKLCSKAGFKGIAKKVMILSLVTVAHLLDLIIISGDNRVLRDMVIFFYLANEGLSILENVGKTDLPIPQKLKDTVEILKGKGE